MRLFPSVMVLSLLTAGLTGGRVSAAEEPAAAAPGRKVELKAAPEGDAVVIAVEGQEKLRLRR